jgi:hypothetical protein
MASWFGGGEEPTGTSTWFGGAAAPEPAAEPVATELATANVGVGVADMESDMMLLLQQLQVLPAMAAAPLVCERAARPAPQARGVPQAAQAAQQALEADLAAARQEGQVHRGRRSGRHPDVVLTRGGAGPGRRRRGSPPSRRT